MNNKTVYYTSDSLWKSDWSRAFNQLTIACEIDMINLLGDIGGGLAQWWESSPPTNVCRVRFPDPASYVGWVCCWFSTLLRKVFLRVLRFSSLLKNQHIQIPIRSRNARPRLNEFFSELLGAPWVNKLPKKKTDIAFIMSSSTSAWLLSPLECSPRKQNGWTLRFCFRGWIMSNNWGERFQKHKIKLLW